MMDNTNQACKINPQTISRNNPKVQANIEKQIKYVVDNCKLSWIPFEQITIIKLFAKGGFANIYSAKWTKKCGECIQVALKSPKISNADTLNEFIHESKVYSECDGVTKIYGITRNPQSEEFMMVLEYANSGSLRTYLEKQPNLEWQQKLQILLDIITSLEKVHSAGYIHRDLHSGNLLCFSIGQHFETKVADLGFARSIKHNSQSLNNDDSDNSCVMGILPYIDPGVIRGNSYTKASDIYSFGVIMTEISTSKPPFKDVPHDIALTLSMCRGVVPQIATNSPLCYKELALRCLDLESSKRPSAKEVAEIIRSWQECDYIKQQFISANESQNTLTQTKIRYLSNKTYDSTCLYLYPSQLSLLRTISNSLLLSCQITSNIASNISYNPHIY